MPQLLTLEAANLFVAEDVSEHLAIKNVKLPVMEDEYIDHNPGGALRQIELPMRLIRIECTFSLIGWQPYIMRMMTEQRPWLAPSTYQIFGVLRDQETRTPLAVHAAMEGFIGRIEPDDWQRGQLHAHGYSIRGITNYVLTIDGTVVHDWDFYKNTLETYQTDQPQSGLTA